MASKRRILITGSELTGAPSSRSGWSATRVEQVIGIDTTPPPVELERTEFIEADIRSPVLARLLPATGVDTVVHCGILWYPEPGKPGAGAARDQRDRDAAAARRLRAAPSAAEGHRPRLGGDLRLRAGAAPSFFTEEMAADFPLRTRFQRDIGELEEYFDNFARRHPS